MTEILEKNKDILVLASNYKKFYMKNEKISGNKLMIDNSEVYKYKFDEKWLFVKRPGCVYGLKKEAITYVKKYVFDDCPHDALLWWVALMLDRLYIYNRMTIEYRRHDKTTTGRENKNKNTKLSNINFYLKAVDFAKKFIINERVNNGDIKLKYISNTYKWCCLRKKAFSKRSYITWIELFRYVKYYFNFKSYLGDLCIILKDE